MPAMSSKKVSIICAALLALTFAVASTATSPVGQVVSAQATIDGVKVPSGTTLVSSSVVEAGTEAAVLRLLDGTLVGLDRQSSARLEARATGGVEIAALAGDVAYRESDGSIVAIGEGTTAILDQSTGEVGGGEPIDPEEEIAICYLEGWSPELVELCTGDPEKEDCKWVRQKIRMADLARHLRHADVYAKKDLRTSEMDEEIDCRRVGAWWWLSALALVPVVEDDDIAAVAASPIVP